MSIQYSNSQSLEHESPPITTRPGLVQSEQSQTHSSLLIQTETFGTGEAQTLPWPAYSL